MSRTWLVVVSLLLLSCASLSTRKTTWHAYHWGVSVKTYCKSASRPYIVVTPIRWWELELARQDALMRSSQLEAGTTP